MMSNLYQKGIWNYIRNVYSNFLQSFYAVFLFTFFSSCGFSQERTVITESFLSVKEFGAIGDGKRDDSKAFQLAIDFCEKNGKKTLIIPEGNYLLKSTVTFRRGGVQLLGVGALLREESWFKSLGGSPSVDPFSTCTILVPPNSVGFTFSPSVSDPIRIMDIQFKIDGGRRVKGITTGILFASEFQGPTWPFIVERCHFRGFNYALKFSSNNQYNVAFVQMRQNSFSQNDECIYFDDIPKATSVGIRNLAWGFLFENNLCHDNSRVIRATFAKDAVNIRNNNFEGNIKYSVGSVPENIIDLEISNCTVNFEGNHFESIISDAVYISSVFKDKKGNYLPYVGSTASGSNNKVFIKGNNFDGVNTNKFKTFLLKGLLIYNYDQVPLYLEESDVRLNESNEKNLNFTPFALKNGTSIKIQKKYEDILMDLSSNNISIHQGPASMNRDFSSRFSSVNNKNSDEIMRKNLTISKLVGNERFLGVIINIENQSGTGFLGLLTQFTMRYKLNGKDVIEEKFVRGNYGYKLEHSVHVSIIPNNFPSESTERSFSASLVVNKDVIGDKSVNIGQDFILFSSDKNVFQII